ncbi:MAG TPA: hypothetical protein PLV77_01725 [Solirubrobacterales bacterium]|nr:hypothetical protein [Solirubrobacterales bacterium]HNC93153.1 hypothetical protein [Solirubrobacterales bacterium]
MVGEPPRPKQPPGRIGTLARLFHPKALNRKHPHVSDRLRTFMATLTFLELVLIFVLLIVASTVLLGLTFWWLAPSQLYNSYWDALGSAFFTLIGMPPGYLDPAELSGRFKVAVGAAGLFSLLLPALFLGAIVFRLFVRLRIFVLKERPTLTRKKVRGTEGWYLAIRLYSSTAILIVDIDFKVYLRMKSSNGLLLSNEEIRVTNATWPIADTHVPYTLYLPVDDGDLDANEHLISLQGHDLETCESAIIHIRGASPQLASEVNETHTLKVPLDLSPADFGGVQVLYDGRGPDWVGWDEFEADRPLQ